MRCKTFYFTFTYFLYNQESNKESSESDQSKPAATVAAKPEKKQPEKPTAVKTAVTKTPQKSSLKSSKPPEDTQEQIKAKVKISCQIPKFYFNFNSGDFSIVCLILYLCYSHYTPLVTIMNTFLFGVLSALFLVL